MSGLEALLTWTFVTVFMILYWFRIPLVFLGILYLWSTLEGVEDSYE
jgi:hypothetical protein